MMCQLWQLCGNIAPTGLAEILSNAENGKFRLKAVIQRVE